MSYDNDTLVTMTPFALTANFGTALIDCTGFRAIQALEKIGPDHSLRPFLPNNSKSFTLSCLSVLTLGRHITDCLLPTIPRSKALPGSAAWRSWGFLKKAQSFSSSLQISSALAKGTDVDFSFNPAVSQLECSKASAFHAKLIHHSFSNIAGGLSPSTHTHPSRDRG